MLLRRHRPDNEALSALLDGQLAGRQLDALQAHLPSCGACRERLDALRRTRDALRALPQVDAPRSFRIRAADVVTPAPVRRAPVVVRAMPLLGAVAALVFVVVLEADLARGGSSSGNESTGLQALSAATHAANTASGGTGQIGAADSAAPTAADAARQDSSGYASESPAAGPTDNAPGEAGAPPAPEGATPAAAGSPQPALGLAPMPTTPSNQQAAPNVPAPAAPPTGSVQPAGPRSAATHAAPTPAGGREAASAPTSSSSKSVSSQTRSGGTSRSDVTYHVVEAIAAAAALAAIAGSVAWRIRNRKVGP